MQKIKETIVADIVERDSVTAYENVQSVYVPVPTIRKMYNSWMFPKRYEVNRQPSLTVPDEAMSIQEIVNRYAHGMPLPEGKVGEYFGEDSELPHDMSKLDLAEREEILREVAAKRDEIIESVNKRKAEAQEKRLKQQVDQRVKKAQEEKEQYEQLKQKFEGGNK